MSSVDEAPSAPDGVGSGADEGDGGGEAGAVGHPWTGRCEVLALLATLAVVGVVVQFLLQALHAARFGVDGFDWDTFIWFLTAAVGPGPAALLVVALALVVLSPGERVGRLGGAVLQALSVVGVLVATLAAVAVVETFRSSRWETDAYDDVTGALEEVATITGLEQASVVAAYAPAGAVAGAVAFLAWRTLGEVFPSPRVRGGRWEDLDDPGGEGPADR